MSEINNDDIKQEVREDIKDILDNIEDEYDDDDIQIDESDVDDFLTDDESDNTTSDLPNYTSTSLVPKEEPFDTSSHYSAPASVEDYNNSIKSEISDNFDTS